VARILNLARDEDGFFKEAHPKLRTMESGVPGVFLAGCCQSPKDIPDTVAQAKAAASAAMIMLAAAPRQETSVETLLEIGAGYAAN
jgi:heterodisulfide reductase subunit A